MKRPIKRAFLSVLVIGAAVAAFSCGGHLRASFQRAYTISSARSELSRLELMSAYQPSSAVSDVGERGSEIDLQPMETFYRVLRALRENYVERIEGTQEREMAHGALRAMLQSLNDTDSRFLDPGRYEVVQDQQRGEFHGIGAVLAIRSAQEGDRTVTKLVVVTPMPGSPAEKGGLKAGDVIAYLGGKWIISYDPYAEVNRLAKLARSGQAERLALIRASEAAERKLSNATTVSKAADALTADLRKDYVLTISRASEKLPLRIKLTAGDTLVKPVSHRLLADKVGYLGIKFFTEDAPDQVAAALANLAAQGATKLALDLRGCSGGSQEAALKAAAEIAPGRVLGVLLKAHDKDEILRLGKPKDAVSWSQVVVLVDRGTAGLGELVAAGLRDSTGAVLVGDDTFGDARQQTIVPQKDGSAVIFTTGEYLTPKRYKFDEKGLTAQVKAPMLGGETDGAIQKALEILAPEPAKEEAHA